MADTDSAEVAQRKVVRGLSPWFDERGERQAQLIGQLSGLDFAASPTVKGLDPRSLRDQALMALRAYLQGLAAKGNSLPVLIVEDLHWAEGNPYYMEELVRRLIDDGVIATGGPLWTVQLDRLDTLRLPTTLVGLLQARLDALPTADRQAARQASVIGHVFWDDALHAVDADATQALPALQRAAFVKAHDSSDFEGTPERQFDHHLLHQVTYDTRHAAQGRTQARPRRGVPGHDRRARRAGGRNRVGDRLLRAGGPGGAEALCERSGRCVAAPGPGLAGRVESGAALRSSEPAGAGRRQRGRPQWAGCSAHGQGQCGWPHMSAISISTTTSRCCAFPVTALDGEDRNVDASVSGCRTTAGSDLAPDRRSP